MLPKKRIEQFLKLNFPDWIKYDILVNEDERVQLLLDYGKNLGKLKVTIQQSRDSKSLINLIDTQFVD